MAQGKITSIETQTQVLTFIEVGEIPKWIMERLHLPKSTFYDIASRGKIKEVNEYKSKPGRHESLTKSQKMRIENELKKTPRLTINKLKNKLNLHVSNSTISLSIRNLGIQRRKMKGIPNLTATHKQQRLKWALEHADPNFDWSKWIWTDEKKFNLDGPDGFNYYWHTNGMEQLKYSCNASSKKSIMVWGGISKWSNQIG